MPDTETLALNKFQVVIVRGLLGAPGWSKDTGTTWRAGQILEERIPELGTEPKQDDETGRAEWKAWATTACPIEVTPKQKDVIKKCVEHFITGGQVSPSRYLMGLLSALGLKPEE